jgi:hypothetical protein
MKAAAMSLIVLVVMIAFGSGFMTTTKPLYPYGNTVNTAIYWLGESTMLFVSDKNPKPTTQKDAANRWLRWIAFVYVPSWASKAWGTRGSWTIAAIDLCSSSVEALEQ